MATPESIAAAFAEGMMRAMLATPEKPTRKEKPVVVKTDDIEAAVAKYIDTKLGEPQEPVQEPLFPEPQIDYGEPILRAVHEARARANGQPSDEPPPGTFDPNQPGAAPWQSPHH